MRVHICLVKNMQISQNEIISSKFCSSEMKREREERRRANERVSEKKKQNDVNTYNYISFFFTFQDK